MEFKVILDEVDEKSASFQRAIRLMPKRFGEDPVKSIAVISTAAIRFAIQFCFNRVAEPKLDSVGQLATIITTKYS
jgi:hypothetical protein